MPVRCAHFVAQHGVRGHVAVPFDQRGDGADARKHVGVQRPHRIGDRRAMVVDQQCIAVIVDLLRMAGQVDLADGMQRQGIEVGQRITLVVAA